MNTYLADLHIHSRFSMATSRDIDPPRLDWWARRKGLGLIGTGDCLHPGWLKELEECLVPAGEGVYRLREELALPEAPEGEEPRFLVAGEVSAVYRREDRTRRVHLLLLLPGLEAARAAAGRLERYGKLASDGRPTFSMDCRELLSEVLEACPEAEAVPAHIWTPHYSMMGAFTGFESVEDCFGDLAGHIHAVETGLSSDPAMNWRVPALDGLTLVSNSDAHSPSKLGREANLLGTGRDYPSLVRALRTGEGFVGTVEFFPEEGKYHLDGHRKCGVRLTPAETLALGGVCPVCGRKLTVGVEHRVEALAGRPAGEVPEGAKSYRRLTPLREVIAASLGISAAGKRSGALYERMLRELGPELMVLQERELEDVRRTAGPCVAEGLRRLRAGEVELLPGFDGEGGRVGLLSGEEIRELGGIKSVPKEN